MTNSSTTNLNYISTILEVSLSPNTTIYCFNTVSHLSVQQGRRIASRFSWQNSTVKAVYDQGKFWLISHPTDNNDQSNWQEQFSAIAQQLRSEIGSVDLTLTAETFDSPPPRIISQLARQILNGKASKQDVIVEQQKHYQIYRELELIPELIFPERSGIALNWKTSIKPTETIKDYWLRTNKNSNQLLNLQVKNRFANRTGIIDSIIGTCETERDRLLNYDLIPSTRRVIENSKDEDLVVCVKDNQGAYGDYVIEGLELVINEENASLVGLTDYETYRKQAIMNVSQWQKLLEQGKQVAQKTLKEWEFKVGSNYVNSVDYKNILLCPSNFNKDKIKLEFGNNIKSPRNQLNNGFKKGGIYYLNPKFRPQKTIQAIALKLCQNKAGNYLDNLSSALNQRNFSINFVEKISLEVKGNMSEQDVAKIDKELERLIFVNNPDLFLTILPEGDKQLDDTNQGSYYHYISQKLLKQGIPSQMVSVENLNNQYIINNIVLGILAKLGNLPFVLADPLRVANVFLGLDVARLRKSNRKGTQNACACVRLYGSKGEFLKYYLEQDQVEGEEIPARVLRKFTPNQDLANKTALIFRDGRFRGEELKFLQERGEAINTDFIFVEITKDKTCRLFNYQQDTTGRETLQIPSQYLLFRHSDQEATVVTTNPSPSVGLASPIRITIREEGIVPSFRDVLEATLKLCLLHHGSYKEPKLPVPIHHSDRIGYKALKGLYHTNPEGYCQWWL